jgi:hypothetical protein
VKDKTAAQQAAAQKNPPAGAPAAPGAEPPSH